mmetsp:Transcript_50851/g.110323  ORF Transcript_50851/g.110323 Transcript_50851/m.110323 type:complete len:236 (-) Transcript_50851:587-1294(-)
MPRRAEQIVFLVHVLHGYFSRPTALPVDDCGDAPLQLSQRLTVLQYEDDQRRHVLVEGEEIRENVYAEDCPVTTEDVAGDLVGLVHERTYTMQISQEGLHRTLRCPSAQLHDVRVSLLELAAAVIRDVLHSRLHIQLRYHRTCQDPGLRCACGPHGIFGGHNEPETLCIAEDKAICVLHDGALRGPETPAIHDDTRRFLATTWQVTALVQHRHLDRVSRGEQAYLAHLRPNSDTS